MGSSTGDQNSPRWVSQILAVTAISLGSYINGTTMSLPTAVIPSLMKANLSLANSTGEANSTEDLGPMVSIPFHIYDSDISLFASLPSFGSLAGSLVVGPLASCMGRKWSIMMGVNMSLTLGYALIAGAQYKWMMFLGRFFHGVAITFSTAMASIYIMEVATSNLRGRLAVVPGIFGTLGILTVQILGSVFDWRTICIICGSFNLPFFLGLLFIPETPVYLITNNHIDKAHKVLRRLRGPNWDITEELTNIKVAAEGHKASQGSEGKVQIRELFSQPALRPLLISLALMLFLQLSGITVIVSFTQQVFQMAHSSIDANRASIYFGLSLLVSNAATLLVADRMPRRIMLLLSSAFVSLCLTGLGLFMYFESLEGPSCDQTVSSTVATLDQHQLNETSSGLPWVCTKDLGWLPLVIMMLYIFFFSLGYGCMLGITMVEILPQRVRTICTSAAYCFGCVCSFLMTSTYLDLVKATSSQAVYLIYGGASALGCLFIFFTVPETKGKTEAEIQGSGASSQTSGPSTALSSAGQVPEGSLEERQPLSNSGSPTRNP